MTESLLFDVLFHAAAVAVSPEAIFSSILVLMTNRARSNSIAYLLGWLTGLCMVLAIVLAFDDIVAGGGGPLPKSDVAGFLRIGFGAVLLLLAANRWRKRRRAGQVPLEPRWLGVVERFGPKRCFVWGFILSGLNPKNVALTVTGALHLSLFAPSLAAELMAVAAFIVIGSSTVAAPGVLYVFAGNRAQTTLQRTRAWLIRHSDRFIIALFLVFGLKLTGDGVANLFF